MREGGILAELRKNRRTLNASCSTLCIHNYSASTKLSTNLLSSPVVSAISAHTHTVPTDLWKCQV